MCKDAAVKVAEQAKGEGDEGDGKEAKAEPAAGMNLVKGCGMPGP